MEQIKHYFLDRDIEFKEVDPGVFRKVIAHHDGLMICHLHFEKGAIGKLHEHFHEQCTYVLSGKFEMNIGGEKCILASGDSTYKEPHVIHGAICLEEGDLLDIFTPERKDFLN
ncbi:MAG: cupin domain-containing protein [Roseburia sp.]|nr:cupin domain-containing protein [Anaeroplasma bactoclasticum]MCM1196208.1 cupin domain-containing protein [Roseburia sp.]MCM1556025.1 cupin domain-containing protein [Anaeroplasma bactoclasticum]